MKIIRHGQNLVQIEQQFPFSVNVYLVVEPGGLTLIDAGLPGTGKAVLRAARDVGLPLRRIALTHAHSDHVGALPALREAWPEAEIALAEDEARLLKHGVITGGLRPDRLFAPGDRVGSLEVIAAPGHTLGHVAFLDGRDRSLIAGDAFVTAGGVHVSGMRHLGAPITFLLRTADQTLALRSAASLRDLRPSRLAVGHGPVLGQPAGAMDRAVQEAERRFQAGMTGRDAASR